MRFLSLLAGRKPSTRRQAAKLKPALDHLDERVVPAGLGPRAQLAALYQQAALNQSRGAANQLVQFNQRQLQNSANQYYARLGRFSDAYQRASEQIYSRAVRQLDGLPRDPNLTNAFSPDSYLVLGSGPVATARAGRGLSIQQTPPNSFFNNVDFTPFRNRVASTLNQINNGVAQQTLRLNNTFNRTLNNFSNQFNRFGTAFTDANQANLNAFRNSFDANRSLFTSAFNNVNTQYNTAFDNFNNLVSSFDTNLGQDAFRSQFNDLNSTFRTGLTNFNSTFANDFGGGFNTFQTDLNSGQNAFRTSYNTNFGFDPFPNMGPLPSTPVLGGGLGNGSSV